ncbi:sodium:proton antiporter [Alicyclobacillus cycloheptanicus]|nr:sodium:proton antiporter [Alicyclobacillus cycloheptanicus]
MAPDFRIITVAPVMKSVFSRFQVPMKKVAYVIDVTSTPLVAIVPIGTAFVGYMVGLLQTVGRHAGVGSAGALSPYHLFLQTIPLNFYSIAMLALGLVQTFRRSRPATAALPADAPPRGNPEALDRFRVVKPEFLPNQPHVIGYAPAEFGESLSPDAPHPALDRAASADDQDRGSQASDARVGAVPINPSGGTDKRTAGPELPDPVEVISESVRPNIWNLVGPLALLLGLTLYLTWWNGHFKSPTLFGALAAADASTAMLQAVLITLVAMFIWYVVQRQPFHRTMFGFLAGGNEMMGVIVLLALIWAVSAVSTDLGFTAYTQRTIGTLVPSSLIAPALFVFGCLISYVIGSSFGAWGILLPLGMSLAASTHASVALVAGAVFASGTFGGFASPLSDNTVAMATVMKLDTMAYARYKLWPGLIAAGVSTVAYGVVGWLMPAVT